MKKIDQVIEELKSMGFTHLSKHKLYGVWFIGLGVGFLNMRHIRNLATAYPYENYSVGNYTALSEMEMFLRTNISVS